MWTSSVTDLFSFVELSTLHMRTGWGRGMVSSWCFCTKLQFMNMPVAPESRRADVEMDVREVRSTWTLRERGGGGSLAGTTAAGGAWYYWAPGGPSLWASKFSVVGVVRTFRGRLVRA